LGLYAPDGGEELRAPSWGFEPRIKIRYGPGRSLDTDKRFDYESSLLHLASQFLGEVEVGCGEPFRPFGGVTVLPLPDVALDDRLKLRVQQKASKEAIDGGSEARDGRSHHHTSGTNYPPGFAEGLDAIVS
jgi:hypothetical protein